MGGFRTRKKDHISKIIVDIDEGLHDNFKTICKARGCTIKGAVTNLIKQFVNQKISLDKRL